MDIAACLRANASALFVSVAGKTTTLSMLCCDTPPTSGQAFVGGHPITGAPAAVQRRLGYCPQRDPLLDLLTVREHLHLYARLKGMPPHLVAPAAEAIWRRVGLGPFADRLAGTLSGGNKRKLSLGIGIIGSPAVLLCDEPSSGLDPQARRNLWDVISASTSDMAVILTTHSLDEAEALCQRIAIMVSGSLRCIGSSQMLKERYGEGHVLDVKAPRGRGDELVAFIAAKLPAAVLSERHAEKLRLIIPREAGLPLSRVFAAFQDADAPAEDWAVTPSSLDAVFCTVAAAAHDDDAQLPPADMRNE
jgi:ABC-type multidrug transport system ATPase subunit